MMGRGCAMNGLLRYGVSASARYVCVCVCACACMRAVVVLLLLDRFYDTELFSALQQTDCALVVCDSKSVIIFL